MKIINEKIFVVFTENFGRLYNTKLFYEKNAGPLPHNSEIDNNILYRLIQEFHKIKIK